MAVVVSAMSRRRGRLSTAETWVVGGREAEAVGSARCGASRDEADLAEFATSVRCPLTFSSAAGRDRPGRSLDPADRYRMCRHACANRRDCVLPAHAPPGAVAWAAG